jgi:hypothetical protein
MKLLSDRHKSVYEGWKFYMRRLFGIVSAINDVNCEPSDFSYCVPVVWNIAGPLS